MTGPADDDENSGSYASPPCFMHELSPEWLGLPSALDAAEEARLGRALLRDLPDAVIYAARDGKIRYWNAGAERIFGFTAAEAAGQSLDIIIPERLRARHWQGWDHMLETGHSRYGAGDLLSVPAVTKDGGKLSVQFTLAPVLDDAGAIAGIAALLRDVTETFGELKRLRERLRGGGAS